MAVKLRFIIAVIIALGTTPYATQQAPTGCEDHTLATQDISLFYLTCGSGAPVLLLHGFSGVGASWGPIIPLLAAKYQVIIPDLRGHGRSTNPSGEFTHRQSATDMLALLDSLKLPQVAAMGFSSGGMTLLHMATRQPSRVHAMVLIGATTFFPEQARRIMSTRTVESITPEQYADQRRYHVQGDEQIRSLQRQFNAFKDSYDDMNFTPPYLSTITARTLIIHGDRDEFFAVDIPVQMYTSIPKSYLWIVPNGGHAVVTPQNVDEFVAQATRFLAGEWK